MKFDLARFRALAETFTPIVLHALGQPQLASIAQEAIIGVETFAAGGHHSGEQKKAFAMATIGQGLTILNAVRPGTVPDVLALESVVSDAIDVTVQVINTAHLLSGEGGGANVSTGNVAIDAAHNIGVTGAPGQQPPAAGGPRIPPFVPEAPLSGDASVETPNIPGGPR